MSTLLWDQHTCLPLRDGTDVAPLTRYQQAGGALVSVNAGYSPQRFADTMDDVDAITGPGASRWCSIWRTPTRSTTTWTTAPGR